MLRAVLTKILKPHKVRPFFKLTTRGTHFNIKTLGSLLSSPHSITQNLLDSSFLKQNSQSNPNLGFKILHFEKPQTHNIIHVIQMHQYFDEVDTIASVADKDQTEYTNDSFCFQEIGTIQPKIEACAS